MSRTIHFSNLFYMIAVATLLVGLLAVGIGTAVFSAGTTYHIDCDGGSDNNDGISPDSAWRTTTRANQQTYEPGDQILFKRGTVCSGERFQPVGDGEVNSPIIIADYDSSELPKPKIIGVGEHEPAIMLLNVKNYIVRNLNLTQTGQTPAPLNEEKGKDKDEFSDEYMRAVLHILGLGTPGDQNCGEPCTVRNIRLENLEVHDGSWNGIYASGGFYQINTGTFGYIDNLTIDNVKSWFNHKAGIEITSTYHKTQIYPTTNVTITNSYLHDNGGDGIMMGPVENGLIDGNECAYNGRIRNARLGCWTWDSLNTTIQFNESHHNMTPLDSAKARDGGGFSLDLGTEDGMIQYNWSHDNEGEGVLLLTWPIGFGFSRGVTHDAQVRYNILERDGQKLGGGITVFGGVDPAVIYNNTVYYVAARSAGTVMFQEEGGALTTDTWGKSGNPNLHVYNNIFITDGTKNPSAVSNNAWSNGKGTFSFDHNLWWRVEGGVRFDWGGEVIDTWTGWQALGFDPNGINADPQLLGKLGGGPAAYKLSSGSPAIDAGRIVTEALRGIGDRDYFDVAIPQGGAYDIGAAGFESGGFTGGWMSLADIYTTDADRNPQDSFRRGDTVYYQAQVVDQNNALVSGATVTTEVVRSNGNVYVTLANTTDQNGWALFSTKINQKGTYTINVTNVSKSEATYNPNDNVKDSHQFTVN